MIRPRLPAAGLVVACINEARLPAEGKGLAQAVGSGDWRFQI